ncbi:MAG: 23S rRNA (uracil(1939)-C(5))-methyltransferase RlmD, partial [bacterium]
NTAVYGIIERLLSPSPERRTPDCPVYPRCGGCRTRHMSYAEELRFKSQRVEDALRRIGGLELPLSPILGAAEPCGYRNKTIYTVGRVQGHAVTGFYQERSHDLISAPDCRLESEYAKRAAAALRGWMNKFNIPAFSEKTRRGVRRLMCRFGFASREGQIVLVTGEGSVPQLEALVKALRGQCPETVSILQNRNPHPGDTVLSHDFRLLWGRETMEDTLCSLRFSLAADAFYQVNRTQAERLYAEALSCAALTGEETALDLYCGAGTITLALARQAKEVIGVEVVESAVENARRNAAANGIQNARFLCADAGKAAEALRAEGQHPDVIVVDPPRKGLLPEVPAILASLNPGKIIYVSCNPATLARDLKLLAQQGYPTQKATPVDMFPGTCHVECVTLMTRK